MSALPAPKNRVVFDVNVFMNAAAGGSLPKTWPLLPPRTSNPYADCVGIVNDAREWSLFVSPRLMRTLYYMLVDPTGFGWDPTPAETYCAIIRDIAQASGGAEIKPNQIVVDCPDNEDNSVLELALAAQANILVTSDHKHLIPMSPWRGIAIITPDAFRKRVEVARRNRR